MTPALLQGSSAAESRLQTPFRDFESERIRYRAIGFLIRTPQCGGHWISVLPPSILGSESEGSAKGVLCDSLWPFPFRLVQHHLEELLLACALEGTSRLAAGDPHGMRLRWGCFLVTDAGGPMPRYRLSSKTNLLR